jgi:hypothetical protein
VLPEHLIDLADVGITLRQQDDGPVPLIRNRSPSKNAMLARGRFCRPRILTELPADEK